MCARHCLPVPSGRVSVLSTFSFYVNRVLVACSTQPWCTSPGCNPALPPEAASLTCRNSSSLPSSGCKICGSACGCSSSCSQLTPPTLQAAPLTPHHLPNHAPSHSNTLPISKLCPRKHPTLRVLYPQASPLQRPSLPLHPSLVSSLNP